MHVKYVEVQTSSYWWVVEIKQGGCQFRRRPSYLTVVSETTVGGRLWNVFGAIHRAYGDGLLFKKRVTVKKKVIDPRAGWLGVRDGPFFGSEIDHFSTTTNGVEVSVPTPRSYVINFLQNKLIEVWESWWSNSNTGLKFKSFFPNPNLDINPHPVMLHNS
ncbi:hypothetical protein TNCV_192481 [Trichonephila clavipes]|nr:hypothetical protein TNCV_192481 [Trichonephila clavipes]